MGDVDIPLVNSLISSVGRSNEKIDYDPTTQAACLAAIDNWTHPDFINVLFAAPFSSGPEPLAFITKLRSFLDRSRPNIFNLLLGAPLLTAENLSMIGSRLLKDLDPAVHVIILVIIPTQSFANSFVEWRKKEFRCNHLFLAKLGRTELSKAFWDSFQLGDDLAVLTIEDIDGEETVGQILARFTLPQTSVQVLRLGNIKNVPREALHAGLILTGVFDTLPLGLQIKMDGEDSYSNILIEDRMKAMEIRIKGLINEKASFASKHLTMMFIGTGGKASGKTSTIRSLFGKSFKPDLLPTQCAEVVAQVQVPTDQAMQENAATQWTVYSMKKAVLRGWDASFLERSGALFAVYDFGANSQLFKPIVNSNCIVMLCINLMDMKRDSTKELLNLGNALEQITKEAPLAPVIIIGTHADEFPSPAALKDLDKKLFIKVRSVANQQVQPNAGQKLIFFPIENSRGEMNEQQVAPIRFAVGGLVRRAEESVRRREQEAQAAILTGVQNGAAGLLGALMAIGNRPQIPLPLMNTSAQLAHAHFLNLINKTGMNTFPLGGLAGLSEKFGLEVKQIGDLIGFYKAIGLVIYITKSEADSDILNAVLVLKPNWLYQSFARLIYDPIENSKVYDVPPDLLDDVDNYERTGQAKEKLLQAMLDGMLDIEKLYVIAVAVHWGLITKTADSSAENPTYVVQGMVPNGGN